MAEPIKSEGVLHKYRRMVDFSQIYVPPIKSQNPVRKNGKNVSHIQSLQISFAQGIDYSARPPILIEKAHNENGVITSYELITGNHSMEAMRILNYNTWVFDIYEIPHGNEYGFEDAVRTLQLRENNKLPGLASSEDDVVNIVERLIMHKSILVLPDEESIKNYIDNVCSYMHPQTRSKAVRDVIRKLQRNGLTISQDVITYTAKDVDDFLSKQTNLVAFGNFDHNRQQYGWSVLEGYEYEFIMSAAKKFSTSGKESYFTIHTKSPTEKASVHERRLKMLNTFRELETDLLEVFNFYKNNNRFPWQVVGCLPQDIIAGESEYINLR
jgi:hypothetical protein